MNPSPSRPTLYGSVHPAHPGDGAMGVLAWLSGSKPPTARRSMPSGTAAARRGLHAALAQVRRLAAHRAGIRPAHWAAGVALLVAAGLIGALVAFLSEPLSGLQAAPVVSAPRQDRATSPAGATTAVPHAHARVETIEPAVPVRTTAPVATADKQAPAKPATARASSKPAVASPVEPAQAPTSTDLDTVVIESILPHLPAPRDDTH